MHLLRSFNYLTGNYIIITGIRQLIAQILILLGLISLGWPSILLAGEPLTECFPLKSAWENIELETVNYAYNQNSMISLDERAITLSFNKFENYLPLFYGFSFSKNDLPNIPKITERSAFEEQFRDVKLIALDSNLVTGDDKNKSYRFTPPSEGIWVIYLVAAVNKIPFLEQKGLRITPNVENIRGGSVFSGSSLNLVEPIDYKACVITLER